MEKAKHESTASTPAIAKSRSQISTRKLGTKNDFLSLLEQIDFVIPLSRS
jgi:hypothetical protein